MKSETKERLKEVLTRTIPQDEFLTTSELMKLLKVKHPITIYRLISKGMPVIHVGRHYRFIKHEVIEFLKENSRKK